MFNVTQLALSIIFFENNNYSMQFLSEQIDNNTFESTEVYKMNPKQAKYIQNYFTLEDTYSYNNFEYGIEFFAWFVMACVVIVYLVHEVYDIQSRDNNVMV
ncbi:hypothetical protein EhV002 [Emiliania huxleyi virus 86]|uniref:Putative membrane protein n=1 Tax=Emiliania huxleyi virus 86 (isolate United Kingdom/English Channel/1999) TaxID=654925 RepID=Q4A3B9_EHV8U|nr:hypothetical protein EhV002 [Emiliania huxleyi virus 86]AHA54556.1 putative membrane protein [Emiliania huxleyi virus 145]AHA55597.1 putative membrane protein [Emiliania huxleyi virus 164]CAI65425.1 putative membrane protein [Emiliania huxleyi virus 86]